MGYITAFDYGEWVLRFPALAAVPENVVVASIPVAEIYWRNDGTSPATTPDLQKTLYYLVIAHIVQLSWGAGANASPSPLVGRVSSASEGSVSISAEFPTNANNAWWLQTPWGAMWWQATAAYRTMHYVPGPKRIFNTWPYSIGPSR